MAESFSTNSSLRDGNVSMRELALEAACINRDELEKLYADSSDVVGELRYQLLWHLSQTERACRDLERCAKQGFLGEDDDKECLRERVKELTACAEKLRAESQSILNQYKEEVRNRSRAPRTARSSTVGFSRPVSGNSGRFAKPAFSV